MRPRKASPANRIKELAAFWDTHDLTDFEKQMEEVKEKVFERSSKEVVVTLRLKRKEAEAVQRIAKAKRISSGPLLSRWVKEGIRREILAKT